MTEVSRHKTAVGGYPQARVRLRLGNDPEATRELRRAIDRVAIGCGLARASRFELELAATEALTNALKGAAAGYAVEVEITGFPGSVDVEVADRGRFSPLLRADEGVFDREGGRGIPLMLALVDEVEFCAIGDGTRVRMRKRRATR